jgi:hypothetical protein
VEEDATMKCTLVAVATAIGIAGAVGPLVHSQTTQDAIEISAFAVNMSNIGTGANAVVEITINTWSTEAERERLITTMLEKGPEALLKELTKARVKGRFRIPGLMGPDPHQLRLGNDLHYA